MHAAARPRAIRSNEVTGKPRRVRRLAALASLALLCFGVGGCFLSRQKLNAPLSVEGLGALEPGETTAAQVVELLGAPAEVVSLEGRTAYRYEHVHVKRTGLFLLVVAFYNVDGRSDRSWLFFDEEDVLTHVGTTLGADGARYATPFSDG